MSRHEPRIVLIAGVWLAAGAVANTATESTPQSGGLEEVIVTAQKRSESEQSVPMSITTFSSTALQQKAITEFHEHQMDGRALVVNEARPKPEGGFGGGGGARGGGGRGGGGGYRGGGGDYGGGGGKREPRW